MGPSGSGKTTFLDVLAGRKTVGSITGGIHYGGLPASSSLIRRVTGYVEQFDTLVATLSCYEMLLYTAQLKRPRQESLASKQAAVEQLLTKLGLSCCSSTQIGSALKRGISGGQAKRLNIGIALITDPRVLFLDEPTSGLDSFTANEVMSVVSSLVARDGTTVATTIHSPSSFCFGLFNKLLVLVNGRMIYMGGAGDAAIDYFRKCCCARQPQVGDNLAEWILEAATQADRQQSEAREDDYLAQLFKSSHLGQVCVCKLTDPRSNMKCEMRVDASNSNSTQCSSVLLSAPQCSSVLRTQIVTTACGCGCFWSDCLLQLYEARAVCNSRLNK